MSLAPSEGSQEIIIAPKFCSTARYWKRHDKFLLRDAYFTGASLNPIMQPAVILR